MKWLITILTTALGFASNIFSSILLIQHFAIASTFAILANGMITILLVPMILSVMGPLRTRALSGRESGDRAAKIVCPDVRLYKTPFSTVDPGGDGHFMRLFCLPTLQIICHKRSLVLFSKRPANHPGHPSNPPGLVRLEDILHYPGV